MNKGICFAGNLILDQIKFVEKYPSPGTLTTIRETELSLGGLVCNCAVDTAKLDAAVPVNAVGVLGTDHAGDYILGELAKYPSIETAHIRREGATSYTDVITEPDGKRSFFHYRGANALLGPQDFPFDAIRADIMHIGYVLLLDTLDGPDPEYPTAMCRVLAEARAHGIRTSVDVVSEDSSRFETLVPPVLFYTDYCFLNEIEAERTTGIALRVGGRLQTENFDPCLRTLADMGVARWAVIHTPELSCGYDKENGEYIHAPSFRLPPGFAVSAVGAGDAYASGVLLGAYYGWDLRRSMHAAAAVAAWSLSGRGASDAIKPLQDIFDAMEPYANNEPNS